MAPRPGDRAGRHDDARARRARRASLLQPADGVDATHDEVQWMGVLRSLSALQMYQRATRGPIDGEAVVRFLLFDASFPRSVQGCLDEARPVLVEPARTRTTC